MFAWCPDLSGDGVEPPSGCGWRDAIPVGRSAIRRIGNGSSARGAGDAGQFSRWGRGARPTRRVREESPPGELGRVGFITG